MIFGSELYRLVAVPLFLCHPMHLGVQSAFLTPNACVEICPLLNEYMEHASCQTDRSLHMINHKYCILYTYIPCAMNCMRCLRTMTRQTIQHPQSANRKTKHRITREKNSNSDKLQETVVRAQQYNYKMMQW